VRRLAIVLPVAYRGGTLRATRDLARILATAADPGALDVVVAYPAGVPDGLGSLQAWGLAVRSFQWRTIDRADAARMAAVSLVPFTRPIEHERYCLPSDGAADLLDCDFWLFVSDRVEAPLLPARPYGVVVFDCLQR
jgi:hypothetical protein